MKRRLHASLGLLLLALLVAPSCRSPGSGLTVIRFWALGAEGEHIRQMVPEFRRRYPGLDVEVQAIPWTAAHEKLLTAFAGNSLPDLFQLGNTWIPEFQVLGALEDLRPRLRASAVIRDSSYFPGIWATNVVDGTLLGIPWYVDTRVLFYRMDLFRQAGFAHPPATWQEWKRLSRALKRLANARGKKAYALLLPTNEWAPPVILGLQCGSSLLKDQNTEGDFSGASFRRAFEFYASFFREQLAPVGITQVTNIYQGIAEGFFAMVITGPWNIGEFRRRMPAELQGEWMTAPLPGPDPDSPGVSLAGGSSLVISRSSHQKDAAWRLIEFLSEPPQQLKFYETTGDLPARREAWSEKVLRENPYTRAFGLQLQYVASPPKIPQWEQIAMKVQDAAELASVGEMSIGEVLGRLDRDVNVILEKRRWLLYGR